MEGFIMSPIMFNIAIIQLLNTDMFFVANLAHIGGMNDLVFVFYTQAAATIFLILPAINLIGMKRAPPLSLTTFCKIFLLSLFGITLRLDIYGIALAYTTPTLAISTMNTLPVITLFLAVLFRQETINPRILSGFAKIVGVVLCLAGAATLAFYEGPLLKSFFHDFHFEDLFTFGETQSRDRQIELSMSAWIKGCFLMLTSTTLWGLWLVLQVRVLESYPSKLLFTTLQCFLGTIQSFVIAIIFERNSSEWRIHFHTSQYLFLFYFSIVMLSVTFYFQTWCVEKNGPVFLAMSTPMSLIFLILIFWLSGKPTSLGSIVSGVLLVGGVYCVMWGKIREQNDIRVAVENEPKHS